MRKSLHVLPFFFLLSACAVRQPAPRTWRFNAGTLIPPGVAAPDLAQRTFTTPIRARTNCLESEALTIRRRRSGITITIHRDALLRQPRGWLTDLIDRAETEGCIPAGQGAVLAARILESLPLPAGAAIRLLRGEGRLRFVELPPGSRLEVITSIRRPGAPAIDQSAEPMQISGSGTILNVDTKAPDDLLGVETAWYDLIAKPGGRGASIVPGTAQLNLRGRIEDRPAPATNILQFAPEISYYRLFYKSDHSAVLGIAATHAALPTDVDSCGTSCFPIPRGIGVNPFMRIVVNGAPLTVVYYATVRGVLQAAKKRPEDVLPTLTISKPFAGHPVNLEFDRTKQEILNLPLTGDEQITW